MVARELEIAWPDLNIIDATFVATESNYDYRKEVVPQRCILVSTDPVAASWYAAKYILTPIAVDPNNTDPDRPGSNYKSNLDAWTNCLREKK